MPEPRLNKHDLVFEILKATGPLWEVANNGPNLLGKALEIWNDAPYYPGVILLDEISAHAVATEFMRWLYGQADKPPEWYMGPSREEIYGKHAPQKAYE